MNPASVIRIPRVESTPLEIGNSLPLTFICGPCQLESRQHALETAEFCRLLNAILFRTFQLELGFAALLAAGALAGRMLG